MECYLSAFLATALFGYIDIIPVVSRHGVKSGQCLHVHVYSRFNWAALKSSPVRSEEFVTYLQMYTGKLTSSSCFKVHMHCHFYCT